jgi:F0F1-type ATP synthase membrane subunit a
VLLVLIFTCWISYEPVGENPNPLQHVFESVHGMIDEQGYEVIGPGHARFTNYLVTIGLFILTCNLIGDPG